MVSTRSRATAHTQSRAAATTASITSDTVTTTATTRPRTSGTKSEGIEEPPAKRRRVATTPSQPERTPEEVVTKAPKRRTGKGKPIELDESTTQSMRLKVESAQWKVGAHVSAAGGIQNAVTNAVKIGATSFALFLKPQRKWTSPPLQPTTITEFKSLVTTHGYNPKTDILPHGSYLVNLGNPDEQKREKAMECFVDDLKRCESVGVGLYNFHPGSSLGQISTSECIAHIAGCINRAHALTTSVVIVIENMAGAGNIIGGKFEEIGEIIKLVKDKERVGVCLDTCHLFAAGYDIRTKKGWDDTLEEFDKHVGLSYLRGMHLNDSKEGLGSKKDRHENIGLGHLNLVSFHHILNDPRTQGMPLILETPSQEREEIWRTEIDVLNEISGSRGSGAGVEPAKQAEDEIDMVELEMKVDRIRSVVKAGNANGGGNAAKPKAKKTAKKGKPAAKGKKAKRKDDASEEDSCCGSDHDL